METSRLQPLAFSPLPLGSVRPAGWLRDQLTVQANGLTGHLDEFWPSVADSKWIGGNDDGWERGPYWLDGLIPLAVLLHDERLLAKAQKWVDAILLRQHDDGWLGPKNDADNKPLDPWPQFVVFKAFTQWFEATGDARILPALLRAARRIQTLLETQPLRSWAKMRWADFSLSLFWLYERTGDDWLLDLGRTLRAQGYDWQAHFSDLPGKARTDPAVLKTLSWDEALVLHGVNNAMGVKSGAIWYRQTGEKTDADNSLLAVETLDKYHGQVTGMFSGDEHLAGLNPIQGTETCTVTEYLFSLEQAFALIGDPLLVDRMERIAYNALPAALTKDMWARQYDQQPNQVLCNIARRDWVSNGPDSNLFSLEGHFGCCTANLHQGWPKFAASLWMKTSSGGAESAEGLAAVAYGPCVVQTAINGARVTITETTDYPFRGDISFAMVTDAPTTFALQLRIPAWASGATVQVNEEPEQTAPKSGAFYTVRRQWQTGDTVTLQLPLGLRRETRFNGAVSLLRGPLVMALRIGEKLEQVGGTLPHADWAVHPTTPWNYGLHLPENAADLDAFAFQETPVSPVPFATDASPVVISIPAYRLPQWEMVNDSAATLTESQFAPQEKAATETVELVPYGSTLLRISEFPYAL